MRISNKSNITYASAIFICAKMHLRYLNVHITGIWIIQILLYVKPGGRENFPILISVYCKVL